MINTTRAASINLQFREEDNSYIVNNQVCVIYSTISHILMHSHSSSYSLKQLEQDSEVTHYNFTLSAALCVAAH